MQDTARRAAPRLSLGPVLYHWPRAQLTAFYAAVADWPVDIVYLGETVCAKRREFRGADWQATAEALASAGKDVVMSTPSLIEAASELGALRRLCRNGRFMVEANDYAAVEALSGAGLPFVGGHSLNLYNERACQHLMGLGMRRWMPPLEMDAESVVAIATACPGLEVEVFAWGRMPLAISARCFSARHAGLAKDQCQFVCGRDADGALLTTRDDAALFALNGVQVQSAMTQNLAGRLPDLSAAGAGVLRISPQGEHTARIVALYAALCAGGEAAPIVAELATLAPSGVCDGYWQGEAGMARLDEAVAGWGA